ncbi:ATP-binding protein [Streptomyces hundungensis]|uniref:ATP-binding protein n=1 Tax=Streptomyces hundungensis TaxID=1077946 RepID=UPI003404A41E
MFLTAQSRKGAAASGVATVQSAFGASWQAVNTERKQVRSVHETWAPRTAWPRLALADEDKQWPKQFRHQARGLLRCWKLEDLADRVDTVLTELVSNALLHGGGPAIVFRLTLAEAGLLVEVADSSPALPHVKDVCTERESGRGLLLVNAFADAWGTRPRSDADGKWTWAAFYAPARTEGSR